MQPDPSLDPHLWREHQARAAALLPSDFADHILRQTRTTRPAPSRSLRTLLAPLSFSALTAACCLTAVIIIHNRSVRAANERHLADWSEVATQVASLDPL